MEFSTLSEKVAYLKGLIKGLKTEDEVIALMADILVDMAHEIEDTQDDIGELVEVVDAIDEDLGEIEKDFYETEDEDDDEEFDFDDDDDEDDFDDDDEELYELTCPSCGDTICINEAMLDEGSMDCPNCGESLEFDADDIEDEAEDEE